MTSDETFLPPVVGVNVVPFSKGDVRVQTQKGECYVIRRLDGRASVRRYVPFDGQTELAVLDTSSLTDAAGAVADFLRADPLFTEVP